MQPIFAEIDERAAQREACSASCSSTIRTARSRNSGENLFVVLLVMAPSSQELEPPANPERFIFVTPRKAGSKARSHLSRSEFTARIPPVIVNKPSFLPTYLNRTTTANKEVNLG